MAEDKVPTPGMPEKGNERRKPPQGDGKTDGLMPRDTRGAGGGGPVGPKDTSDGFHGGQSVAAYHGHDQLGEDEIEGQENANAASKDS